jgi:hypothetical protein
MSLRSFEVSNYRAFVEPARVELKELTLFFGYNNAGKSALARVLPLLRDSSFARRGLPLNLESATVRGGEFADLRSRLTGIRKISLVLEWNDPEIRKVRIVLQDLPERRQHIVESFELEPPDGPALHGEWVVPSGDVMEPTVYGIQRTGGAETRVAIDWLGLIPQVASGLPPEEERLMSALAAVTKGLQDTLWVGAVRSMQPRRPPFPRLQPATIESDGKGAADVLAWDKRYGGDIFAAVSGWYAKNTSTPLDVAIRADEYEIVTGISQVNLSDTGEGLTQVLPVLVAGAMAARTAKANRSSYLVIEQPELHLHPAAHAPLAEFFSTIAAASSAPKIVVETHSENFLFGVQLAVARGQLDPDRVLIHWVRQDEQGYSTITPIRMDRDGRPDAWPKDVFTEEAELARQLLEARRQRGAK